MNALGNCRLCEFGNDGRRVGGYCIGSKEHAIIGIVEQLTAEDLEAETLTGDRMELIQQWLAKAEIFNAYITSAIKCATPDPEPRTREQLTPCVKSWLSKEIMDASPRIILSFGENLTNFLVPGAGAYFAQRGAQSYTDYCGQFINYGPWLLVPMLSPSYVLITRNQLASQLMVKILSDVKAANDLLGVPHVIKLKESK